MSSEQLPRKVVSIAGIPVQDLLLLEQIERLSVHEMLAAWRERFGDPPGCASQPQLFRLLLATRLQETRNRRIDGNLRRRFEALIQAFQKDPEHEPAATLRLKPGIELVRVWKGIAHRVWVLPNGYLWNGQIYTSLTKVTREITGTIWSGPSFFKLKRRTAL